MKYQIWVADLNSLYSEVPNPPFKVEETNDLSEAKRILREQRTFNQAAWIQHSDGTIFKE